MTTAKQELARLDAARKEVEAKLAAADTNIQSLNAALAKLNLEKTDLLAKEELLNRDKGMLGKQNEDLSKTKAQLDADLAALTAKLQERIASLDDLKKERDLLDQKSKALDERVKKLEAQARGQREEPGAAEEVRDADAESLKALLARALERQKSDQAAAQQQMQAVVAKAQEADAQAKEATTRANDYYDRLRRAAVYFKDMDEKKQHLLLQVDALKAQLANALDDLKTAQDETGQTRLAGQDDQSRTRGTKRQTEPRRDPLRFVGQHEPGRTLGGSPADRQYVARTSAGRRVRADRVRDRRQHLPQDGTLLPISGPEGPANRQHCGGAFAHPESRYFGIGKIGRDQVQDYAARKGWTIDEAERWLGPILNYDPKRIARCC